MTPPIVIQQAFDLALQHHQAGRLQEAEALYRQILAQQPAHAGALHLLGLMAHQIGRNDIAANLISRAIALDPSVPEAHINLGNALKDLGQLDAAIAAYRRAIALRPGYAEAFSNLGNALKDFGQLDEAVAAHRQAVAFNPDLPEGHNNLGSALKDRGQHDEAIAAFRKAIALRPAYVEAHSNLGNALRDAGQFDEAIAAFRRTIALSPNYAEVHGNLGVALIDSGQLDEAIAEFRRTIALNPNLIEAHMNLGNALKDKGQLDEAIAVFRQAITLRPTFPQAHNNLGNALKDAGQPDAAITAYQQAIALDPNLPETHNNLGNALTSKGQLDEAIAACRRAIALRPSYCEAHSNLILALHYHPAYDAHALAEEHHRWNREHAEPLRPFLRPHENNRDGDRRLRIGYISPDFRDHAVGRFLLPLLRHHDHAAYQIVCYSDVHFEDAMTDRLRANADEWHKIAGLSDERVAEKIRLDQIDILVDLAAHTAGNRLRVFALKPAPVQATYLAYCSSTGLETIDFRLSDPNLDPPGDESFYSEQTIRLPDTYWCYQSIDPSPDVAPPPALSQGAVTFGCLNNFCKVSPPALDLWIKLLAANPTSRLLLYAPDGSHRRRVRDLLNREGIEDRRLTFLDRVSFTDYFKLYDQIDIALDPFPYNGGTTTCDALWMGVPVVTLRGRTAVGRGGASILTNVGLPDLIAPTPHEYVQIAAALANDLPRLAELRRTLRPRMQASPLMDAPKFTRNVEAAYQQMWQTWRQSAPA
jgi:protein O-GlcNAc transferase